MHWSGPELGLDDTSPTPLLRFAGFLLAPSHEGYPDVRSVIKSAASRRATNLALPSQGADLLDDETTRSSATLGGLPNYYPKRFAPGHSYGQKLLLVGCAYFYTWASHRQRTGYCKRVRALRVGQELSGSGQCAQVLVHYGPGFTLDWRQSVASAGVSKLFEA